MTAALAALWIALLAAPPHPWLADLPADVPTTPLDTHFPTPAGFQRAPAAEGSYAAFLRTLPVRTDRRQVLDFRGQPLTRPAAAVIYLDVGTRDLQQCADSALRLYAEWRWSVGQGPQAAFHFTSGDVTTFREWIAGQRVVARGRGIERLAGRPRARDHQSYRAWLDLVFRYAGTQSLRLDSAPVAPERPLEAGDIFVEPGSPGHAVVLLDVAAAPDGRRAALVGQGFMPAEDFHVLEAPAPATLDAVWFVLPGPGGTLDTPSWRPFAREAARRFRASP